MGSSNKKRLLEHSSYPKRDIRKLKRNNTIGDDGKPLEPLGDVNCLIRNRSSIAPLATIFKQDKQTIDYEISRLFENCAQIRDDDCQEETVQKLEFARKSVDSGYDSLVTVTVIPPVAEEQVCFVTNTAITDTAVSVDVEANGVDVEEVTVECKEESNDIKDYGKIAEILTDKKPSKGLFSRLRKSIKRRLSKSNNDKTDTVKSNTKQLNNGSSETTLIREKRRWSLFSAFSKRQKSEKSLTADSSCNTVVEQQQQEQKQTLLLEVANTVKDKCHNWQFIDESGNELVEEFDVDCDKRQLAVQMALTATFNANGTAADYVKTFGKHKSKTVIVTKSLFVNDFAALATDENKEEIKEAFKTGASFSGAGKSGSWMLWSADRRYIAKSLTEIEISKALEAFPAYFQYLQDPTNTSGSLLTRYLALIKTRIAGKVTYVVVMKNVLRGHRWPLLFDLKGSTWGRYTSVDTGDSCPILKDVNFIQSGLKLAFVSGELKAQFEESLQRDVEFLISCGVLDYSLLVGCADDGSEWTAGLIDILTPFSVKKRAERVLMGSIHGKRTISCAPPAKYAARFLDFVQAGLQVTA